jgi:hypothetical protein
MLVAASRATGVEASVVNMPGTVADGAALVAAIEAAVPGAGALISVDPVSLPFPVEIDTDGIEALGPLEVTPFATGVRKSVEIYRALAAAGRLDAEQHGLPVAAGT